MYDEAAKFYLLESTLTETIAVQIDVATNPEFSYFEVEIVNTCTDDDAVIVGLGKNGVQELEPDRYGCCDEVKSALEIGYSTSGDIVNTAR